MEEKKNVTEGNEKSEKVQETLRTLRNAKEIYVIMSGVTHLPFVMCDEETFDDEVLLYYQVEDAQKRAKELAGEKYLLAIAKLEAAQMLSFYTNLYTMGVNCLAVNQGMESAMSIQLSDLVIRKKPEEVEGGKKLVENPELHLTAIYLMQELRRHPGVAEAELPSEIKEYQEELLAHYQKGTFIVAIQEDGQVPILQQKDGTVYQPIFTDMFELRKFAKEKKMKTGAVPAAKIPEILIPDAKGVAINPFGVNVQLTVNRPAKKSEA